MDMDSLGIEQKPPSIFQLCHQESPHQDELQSSPCSL